MVRVLFVTQDDPVYVPHFFDEFIRLCDDRNVDIVGVAIQAPLGKKSTVKLIAQMWRFYGPFDFARLGFRFVFLKMMNLIAVRLLKGRTPGFFSLEHLLVKNGWEIIPEADVNSKEFLDIVRVRHVDLIVSVAASQVFKAAILSAPTFGCINVHNSRLPKNRGMLPNFWALYHHDVEPTSAMTVHKMNEKLDDGAIILQEDFPLDPNETLHQLIIRTKRLNARLVLRTIALYLEGEPKLLPNDSSQATYNTFPTREDVHRFKGKGLRLL